MRTAMLLVIFLQFTALQNVVTYSFRLSISSCRSSSQLKMHIPVSTSERTRRQTSPIIAVIATFATAAAARSASASTSTITDSISSLCSDSISILRSSSGKEIILIGTAHISEESAKLVRDIIRKSKPEVVMIELDEKRIGKLPDGQNLEQLGFEVPLKSAAISIEPQAPQQQSNALKFLAKQFAGATVGKALSSFYKSVEKLGFTTGGEFQAAIDEGLAGGSRILLGDRDVDITLDRLASALSATDFERFNSFAEKVEKLEQSRGLFQAGSLEVSKETLSSLVEGLKQRDLLEEVELVFSNEIPFVYQALIGERDKFMADAIDSCECKSMVAVVGMAHMSGIERSLNSANYKMFRKICPRVASSVTTINI